MGNFALNAIMPGASLIPDDFFKGKAGTDAGNVYASNLSGAQKAVGDYLGRGQQTAAQELQADPTLAKVFGAGGTMDRTAASEQDLASKGFSLQPEDYEAYGQAAGNIARQLGGSQNSLAQALASRGMAGGGAATQAMMSSEGNKAEMLGQLQMQIAQQRMQMNMQRLQQTRQFLNQLTGQAEQGESMKEGFAQGRAGMGMGVMSGAQQTAEENMMQRAATEKQSPFMSMMQGAVGGAASGLATGGPMGALAGGAGGGAMGAMGMGGASGATGGSLGSAFATKPKGAGAMGA